MCNRVVCFVILTDDEFESGDVTSDGDVSREVIDGEEASVDQSAEESPKVKIKADVHITDTTGKTINQTSQIKLLITHHR